jgi:hypothetical protein
MMIVSLSLLQPPKSHLAGRGERNALAGYGVESVICRADWKRRLASIDRPRNRYRRLLALRKNRKGRSGGKETNEQNRFNLQQNNISYLIVRLFRRIF